MTLKRARKRNPHGLTKNQHVIPVRSIGRFVGADGLVDVMRANGEVIRIRPSNPLFCAYHAWDQRAEHGYMRRIENEFQAVAHRVASGELTTIPDDSMKAVNRYFSLWWHRSRMQSEGEDVELRGVLGNESGRLLTKDEEEILEAKWYSFFRGNAIPARQAVGMRIQMLIDRDESAFPHRRWGIVRAVEGEVIVPDVPAFLVLPVTASILLVADQRDCSIRKANLDDINTKLLAYACRYAFARDLKAALAGVTDAAFRREAADRKQKAALGLLS